MLLFTVEEIAAETAVASIPQKYMWLLLIVALIINVIAFLLMGIDKHRARKHKRRIPEKVLLGFAVCLGSVGILLGMLVFHHKTSSNRHPAFATGVPIILLVELIGLLLLCSSVF